jgi:hypothetical protein
MGKTLLLKPIGLYNGPNRLSELPEGALADANNVIFRQPGVIEPRYAFTAWSSGGSNWSTAGAARSIYAWADTSIPADRLVVHHAGNKLAHQSGTSGDAWTEASGTYTRPDATWAVVRFAEARKNLYASASEGVYRLTAYNATPIAAGIPKPLDIGVASTTTVGALALTDDYAYRYRATVTFLDDNGGTWESAPSHAFVARNSATYGYGTSQRDFTLRIYLPAAQMTGTATSYSVRLYRSKGISGAGNEPVDEQGLVYQVALTSTDISTNGYVDIRDRVPDALIGAAAYFSPSQEGIVASNERPPVAWDMTWHGRRMLYANTTAKHRFTLRLLSASAIVANDTIVIGGRTYTAKASGAGANEYNIITSYSAQVNIQETAKNLVRAINADNSATFYAYYVSGADDPAGSILLEERGIGGSSFALTAGGTYSYWAPQLPTSGTSVSSDNERRRNRVYISKQDLPEAVPLLSYVDVGNEQDDILRIHRLRNSVFVFKRQDGIYRITGVEEGQPSVQLVDPTVRLVAPQTVASLANELYAATDQGFVAVSDTGARIISGPVYGIVTDYLKQGFLSYLPKNSFAVSDEAEHLYIAQLSSSDASGSAALVYNAETDSWTWWEYFEQGSATAGFCAAIGSLSRRVFFGHTTDKTVYGQKLHEESLRYTEDGSFLEVDVTFSHVFGTDPTAAKHFERADFFFGTSGITSSTIGFSTEMGSEGVTLTTSANQEIASVPVPQGVSRGTRLAVQFSNNQGAAFRLLGVAIHYSDDIATRGRR